MSQWTRARLRVVKTTRARSLGQAVVHWRLVRYAKAFPPGGLRAYRTWIWSRTAGYRELNRKRRTRAGGTEG